MYHPNSITGDLHTTHNSLQLPFRIGPLGWFWESDAVYFNIATHRLLWSPLCKILTNTTIHMSDYSYGYKCPVTLFYCSPEQRTLAASPSVLPIFT